MNCRGDEDIDAKRSRPSIGKPVMGHARKERVVLFGTDQRITSGPAAKRPHSKAEYMTAPERFADSQIPLAPRAPSIHDPSDEQSASDEIKETSIHVDGSGNRYAVLEQLAGLLDKQTVCFVGKGRLALAALQAADSADAASIRII